jgi:hypothetical protein
VCSDGFRGDGLSCTPVDPCEAMPCKNAGVCSAEMGTFFCNCAGTGFRGTHCDEAIDDCTPNPCKHGTCSDGVNAYECKCVEGYEGKNCEIDSDDCADKPCKHGACSDLVHDYKCGCEPGYSGKNCDNTIDNCAGKPCARGTCVNQAASFKCECPAGYDGVHCENNRDDCAAKPCVHGTCTDRVDGYECSCESGYDGARCDHNIDDCGADPCVHGTCVDKVNSFSCSCSQGWGGSRCDTGTCANVSCPGSAPCRVPYLAAGICYPSACAWDEKGLCMAQEPNGGGAAHDDAEDGNNSDFDFGDDDNWNKRARFFAYINQVDDAKYVCVFPETDYKGTPIMVPFGQSLNTAEPFGQSNAWPGEKGCP